uniref:Uncharacterized protein n=1 Tax=Tetraselmis sp. GSL018 TaxID=582737 RepID=A0A061SKD3_9CHLO
MPQIFVFWTVFALLANLAFSKLCGELNIPLPLESCESTFCSCYCLNHTHAYVAYYGEFGYELILHLPYAYYLQHEGWVVKSFGPTGTRPLYYFSSEHVEHGSKRFVCGGSPAHSNLHPNLFNFSQWRAPPFSEVYRHLETVYDKPLLMIHNKYTEEWGGPPANFIDASTLNTLLRLLTDRYKVIYVRPGIYKTADIVDDGQIEHMNRHIGALDDISVLKAHPSVSVFQDLLKSTPHTSWNELQMRLHANCRHKISVQGGSSILSSFFPGINLIYAVKGSEMFDKQYDFRWYPRLGNATTVPVHTYKLLISAAQELFL